MDFQSSDEEGREGFKCGGEDARVVEGGEDIRVRVGGEDVLVGGKKLKCLGEALGKRMENKVGERKEEERRVGKQDEAVRVEPNIRLETQYLGVKLEDYLKDKIPQETKKATEYAVRLFEKIMSSAAREEGKEFNTLKNIPVDELPDALGKFLILARKQNGDVYNASSLDTFYQSLARYLASEYEPKLDIKRDPRFKITQQILQRRCTEVAEQGGRPGVNASEAVSSDNIKLAYEKGTLGRGTPKSLITTVHYAMVSGFGCRAIKEIYSAQNEDIIDGPEEKPGLPKWIRLSERITKTRRGRKNDVRDVEGKVYLDSDHPEVCPVRTLLEFRRRKNDHQNAPGQPFLWTVKQSAQANPDREPFWYTNGRMGRNQIGNLFKQAFIEAGVDVKAEKIKGTSGRKNLAQAGADGMVPGGFLSKMMGQKSIDSKLHYLTNKEKSHQAASLVIQRGAGGVSGPAFPEIFQNLNTKKKCNEEQSNCEHRSESNQMFFYSDEDDGDGHTISQSRIVSIKNGTLRTDSRVSVEAKKRMKVDAKNGPQLMRRDEQVDYSIQSNYSLEHQNRTHHLQQPHQQQEQFPLQFQQFPFYPQQQQPAHHFQQQQFPHNFQQQLPHCINQQQSHHVLRQQTSMLLNQPLSLQDQYSPLSPYSLPVQMPAAYPHLQSSLPLQFNQVPSLSLQPPDLTMAYQHQNLQ